MSVELALSDAVSDEAPARVDGRSRRIGAWLGATLLVLVLAVLVFPEWFSSGRPNATDVRHAFTPPSLGHLFGTDELGRDVYTRVVYGAGISLGIGVLAVGIGVVGGVLLGLLSGLGRGWVDTVAMRVVDVLLAVPELLLALLVVAIIGRGSLNVALAIGVAAVPHFARLVRGQALSVLRSEYVEAAKILGVPPVRYLGRHVLPNVGGPLVVMASIGTGSAITAAAGLSVLGLGPPAPSPEWGAMLSEGQAYLGTAWWIAVFPGLAVVVVVLSVTLLGRGVQARRLR
ncbi:ABC transporter permease [Kutzneria buriramensis]|uniref:Peptide/nickel transport system permease protein n=1 Tax=Kutzneria buriramensis TaxID=1045776 RepID=A0A3E0GTV6_9PSEU|nr:ABC transporter permease [Kutzneria buriramensis]REH27620.1 peptide/nickel transport system permease protein [Kutzneria buriramensis]